MALVVLVADAEEMVGLEGHLQVVMAVDVWVYPLIPALGRSLEEGYDESELIQVSSKGAPIVVKLGFNVEVESSQVLRVSLERFDIKLVWLLLTTTLLQQLQLSTYSTDLAYRIRGVPSFQR